MCKFSTVRVGRGGRPEIGSLIPRTRLRHSDTNNIGVQNPGQRERSVETEIRGQWGKPQFGGSCIDNAGSYGPLFMREQ